jgi:hypothetical protein
VSDTAHGIDALLLSISSPNAPKLERASTEPTTIFRTPPLHTTQTQHTHLQPPPEQQQSLPEPEADPTPTIRTATPVTPIGTLSVKAALSTGNDVEGSDTGGEAAETSEGTASSKSGAGQSTSLFVYDFAVSPLPLPLPAPFFLSFSPPPSCCLISIEEEGHNSQEEDWTWRGKETISYE